MSNFFERPADLAARRSAAGQAGLVSWDEVDEEEKALLLRVEARLLQAHAAPKTEAASAPSVLRGGGWPRLATLSLAFGALALVVWFGDLGKAPLPSLQTQGRSAVESLHTTGAQEQRFQSTLQNEATISDPQGWALRSHKQSRLQIVRRGPRHSEILLHQGAIAVEVKPGSMHSFAVRCEGKLQVLVQGTKFLVWQGKDGTRVEVFEGSVVLQKGPRRLLHLYKGQGAYVKEAPHEALQTYPLPQGAAQNDWLTKIEFFAKHQPEILFAYARDLGDEGLLSTSDRLHVLEMAAHAMSGAKRWKEASHLWSQIYALQPHGVAAETALFHAARTCRLSRISIPRCVSLFQQYITLFPQGLASFREASLFWIGALQSQQTPLPSEEAKDSLRRYLQLFPKGVYAPKVRLLLKDK